MVHVVEPLGSVSESINKERVLNDDHYNTELDINDMNITEI